MGGDEEIDSRAPNQTPCESVRNDVHSKEQRHRQYSIYYS